jgi:hypothetical protein
VKHTRDLGDKRLQRNVDKVALHQRETITPPCMVEVSLLRRPWIEVCEGVNSSDFFPAVQKRIDEARPNEPRAASNEVPAHGGVAVPSGSLPRTQESSRNIERSPPVD